MVEIFKALSEESRLRIIAILIEKELCVCEIEEILNLTQSNVSRHLNILKRCGIVESRKDALWSYYYISSGFKEEHKELWQYLSEKIKHLPFYKEDIENYQKTIVRNLCSCKRKE